MTDTELDHLRKLPKTISKSEMKKLMSPLEENGYYRADAKLSAKSDCIFILRTRQSADDPMDFSIILTLQPPVGKQFNLVRYNGNSHIHKNKIENTKIRGTHKHIATQRYMELNCDAEGYAEKIDEYTCFDEALEYMFITTGITSQLFAENTSPSLFD